MEQATLAAGVRAIADHQWAAATYATMRRAFGVAQGRDRTTHPAPQLEVAESQLYVLSQDTAAQTLTVAAKIGDRDIAQFDQQGTVLSASPSWQDRHQWQQIAERV